MLKSPTNCVAALQMPSGDVVDAACRKEEIHAHHQAPHTAAELIAAAQLLPANCFVLSGSCWPHKGLLQGMARGTMPRALENSLYWQRESR